MAKRGRPRGLTLNSTAVEHLLLRECVSKGEIAEAAGITTGHLADALHRGKGLAPEKVRAIAERLHTPAAVIAPEITGRFVGVREGDQHEEAVA